ncbi:HlyD family secretion protein [Bergeyella sp. RCAD1439]|uniref:HlyD family secretion protein n=1 Tax=Bergeyella anatis TaxID=3113737 RepID=UPI002E18C4AD|nr:HlyD family efflux transporter periplasmic adaptor subunit [Bergeyella sp. RCAD1439]
MHSNYSSYQKIYKINQKSSIKRWFWFALGALLLILFLPWTQNIKTKGQITTLHQDQRPQALNSPIPGKITRWYVKNGDQVKKGDTLLQISEIKEDYMDPLLVERTEQQVEAKKHMREYYSSKISTADHQVQALNEAKKLKLSQLENKLTQLQSKLKAEQSELEAASNELKLAKDQYDRQNKMYEEGLVSLTQLQQRSVAYQNANAKKTHAENKITVTRQDLLNTRLEQNTVLQEYAEKVSKIEGEKFASLSSVAGSEGEIAKLQNQVANYKVRQGLYHLIASQDGQIVNISKSGLGEIVKEGENIATIVPDKAQYVSEIYIKPVDLPLVKPGQKVVFTFDGYPAIVFSGWPSASHGTFAGKVLAVENNISANGLFKAIVVEEPTHKPWPKSIKIGTATQGIALLNDVPIWYEIWRNINGFPPNYYDVQPDKNQENAKK